MGCIVTAAAHCLGSSALFLLAGFAYGRTHSRNLFSSQTLSNCYPAFSTFLFILILANLSFPGVTLSEDSGHRDAKTVEAAREKDSTEKGSPSGGQYTVDELRWILRPDK